MKRLTKLPGLAVALVETSMGSSIQASTDDIRNTLVLATCRDEARRLIRVLSVLREELPDTPARDVR